MKIAFLGAGNMGGGIIRAIIRTQAASPSDIYIYDKLTKVSEAMASKYGVNCCSSESEAAQISNIIFVAVKPGIVPEALNAIKNVYSKEKIIISIAAGVAVRTFTDILGSNIKMVRSIPNLPAIVGEGMTGLYFYNFDNDIDEELIKYVNEIFNSIGKVVTVDKEKMIDEMVAVTSSSPAYVCLMIEAMADGAVRAGFSRQQAYLMTQQAVLGTAKLLLENQMHPAVLKDSVCSPGGTTIEAVASLEKSGFRAAILEAMDACAKKIR